MLVVVAILGSLLKEKLCPIIEANAENMRHVTLCVCMRKGEGEAKMICNM